MGPEATDLALLRGDAEAFGAFYARHVDVVRAFVARRVRRSDLTFDLVAETFARALAARRTYDPARGSAIGWLLGIARNLVIDAARRGRVAAETRRRLGLERIELPTVDAGDDGEDPFVDAARVAEAVAALPPDQREPVMQRIVQEEPYAVIAAGIGCSEQVVRKRVSRGLAAVRHSLMKEAT